MGQKKKSIALFVMIASLASMGLTSNQAFAGVQIPVPPVPSDKLDPFLGDWKCYNVTPQKILEDDVVLLDQFLEETYDTEFLIKICTTTFKDGSEDPLYPESPFPPNVMELAQTEVDQHYVVYTLCDEDSPITKGGFFCMDPEDVNLPVTIDDQFGPTFHDTSHDPVELWVPAEKDHNGNFQQLHEVHYKCYDIKPVQNALGQPLVLTLFDQFLDEHQVTINTADKLCNPVDKNNEFGGNIPPIEHLKCYDITDAESISQQPAIKDQFIPGGVTLQMIDEAEFCSAADKFGPAVGGIDIPIDTVSLSIALIGSNPIWILPLIALGAAVGLIAFKKSKKD